MKRKFGEVTTDAVFDRYNNHDSNCHSSSSGSSSSNYSSENGGNYNNGVTDYFDRSESASPGYKKMGVDVDENEIFSSFPSMTVEGEGDRAMEDVIQGPQIRIKFWLPDGSYLVDLFPIGTSVQVIY
jgi:hypothetical protein